MVKTEKAPMVAALFAVLWAFGAPAVVEASLPMDAPSSRVFKAADPFTTAPQMDLPSLTQQLRAIEERTIAASECVALCELAAGIEAHPFGVASAEPLNRSEDAWGNYRFTSELAPSHNRFGFTGHYWDKEASLYYAKARYYDPFTARFTQADSFLGTIDDPPSLHRYFYAHANPTTYTDEDGHSATAVGTAAGFVWGFGQMIGAGADSLWGSGKYRSTGDLVSIWAQNTIAGAQIGASVDIGLATAPLSLTPALGAVARGIVGGLAGAGVNSLTFTGGDGNWSTFAENQAVGAGVGAAVGVVPELGVGLAAFGAYEGYKTAQAGAPEVGYTQMALSLAPFLSKEVRNLSFGRMRTVVSEQILPRLNPFNYELARPSATASTFGAGQFPKYVAPSKGPGQFVPKKEAMSPLAQAYEETVAGSPPGQTYRVPYSNPRPRGLQRVDFDGARPRASGPDIPVDAKVSIVTRQKTVNQAARQADALRQHGTVGVWIVPKWSEALRARRMIEAAKASDVLFIVVQAQ